MKTHTLIALLIGLLVFAACDSKVFYDETCRVDEQGWNMDDKLVYNIDVDDTAQTYLCCLDVRVRNDYPYSNIYFFLSTVYPNGDVAVDTNIEFQLAATSTDATPSATSVFPREAATSSCCATPCATPCFAV